SKGAIVAVNRSWDKFYVDCETGESPRHWIGMNYFAQGFGKLEPSNLAESHPEMAAVISGAQPFYECEYPCHSPDVKRWFMMDMRPVFGLELNYFVISHNDITRRRMAEIRANEMALIDELTDIANRRRFNSFLLEEWKRCNREKVPISIISIDVDLFKEVNDRFGHAAGDTCLQTIASILSDIAKRPRDLCARTGGDEFALILGQTGAEGARVIASKVLSSMRKAGIKLGEHQAKVTLSLGIVTISDTKNSTPEAALKSVDAQLYKAKNAGRDQAIESEM
ncbi:MAG: diguanylate cyclase (GGDEF)-like protein, partial [Planctomycetota bacterium]